MWRWVVAVGFCGVTASAIAAEPQTTTVPEVVVTATRTEESVQDVPNSVTVVQGEDIERGDIYSTADALRGTPGLDVTEFGSSGHSAFASIRGSAADQVQVLLDGVEVNSPTVGQFDFANLTTDNIDRIEILRGGGGSLYGSDAIGGVVNVISRRGAGPLDVTASSEAGSVSTHHEVLSISGAHGPLALAGSTSFFASDGFRSVNDDYRNFSTAWRGDADLIPGGTARAFVRYTNARAGLVNFNVAEGVLDPDAYSRTDFFLAKGEWEHAVTDDLDYLVSTSFVSDNERYKDSQVDEGEGAVEPVVVVHTPGQIIATNSQVDYSWRQFALTTVGLEVKERSAQIFKSRTTGSDDDSDEGQDTGEGGTTSEVERVNPNRTSVAVYAQEQLRALDDTLHGIGGMRYDHIDQFGDEVTWSGSGSYLVRASNTRLRVGYAEGFRAPTFDELFQPNVGSPNVGVENLQPEHSWEINAGVTQEFAGGRVRAEATYFYREVKNFIEEVSDQLPGPINIPDEDDMDVPLARNLDARFQGVELITHAQPLPWLHLSANYTYLNFDTPTGVLLNRPRHRGAVFTGIERHSLLQSGDVATFSLRVQAVGNRDSADPTDDFEAKNLGSYARTDLALSYKLPGRFAPFTITAVVHNLFNRNYSESIGFPAPPANFLMGLRCDLSQIASVFSDRI